MLREGTPKEGPLSVVLVDDHQLFSRGLELLLNTAPDARVRVVARTEDAGQALELVRRNRPQVAIIDLAMPPPGGLAAIETVKRHYPHVRVLALSGTDDIEVAIASLRAGADGFLLKSSEPELLVPPLLTVASGLAVVPRPLLAALLGSTRPGQEALERLSVAERDLLSLIAQGLETTEIAERLFVSERTAKRMVASLLRRIGAANRVQAAALAGQYGLLDPLPDNSLS